MTGAPPGACTAPPSPSSEDAQDGNPYDLSACPASNISASGAVQLNGYLNPNGTNTEYAFEYDTDPSFSGGQYSTISYTGGSPGPKADQVTPEAVSAQLSGLHPGTTYYFRLGAENENTNFVQTADFAFSASSSFTTPAAVAPTCGNMNISATENTPETITLNCTGVSLNYEILSNPAHGSLSSFNDADGTATFTPAAGYVGPDSFTFGATNPGGSASATANITTASHIQHLQPPTLSPSSCTPVSDYAIPVGSTQYSVTTNCLLSDNQGDYVVQGSLMLNGIAMTAGTHANTPAPSFGCSSSACTALMGAYNAASSLYVDANHQQLGSNSSYTLAAGITRFSQSPLAQINLSQGLITAGIGPGDSLYSLQLGGSYTIAPDGSGGSTVTLEAMLPDIPSALRPPGLPGGVQGSVTLDVNAEGGVNLNDLNLSVGSFTLGKLNIGGLSLSYMGGSSNTWMGSGSATIPDINVTVSVAVTIVNNLFKAFMGSVSGLDVPVGPYVAITSAGLNFGVNPLTFGGSLGMTAGPSILGQSAASIDASFQIDQNQSQTVTAPGILSTPQTFPDVPWAFDLQGSVKLVGYIPISSANFDLLTGVPGSPPVVSFSGGLGPLGGSTCSIDPGSCTPQGFDVAVDGVHLLTARALLDGLIVGPQFDAEGSGELGVLNLPDLRGDVLASSKGFAACTTVNIFKSLGLAKDQSSAEAVPAAAGGRAQREKLAKELVATEGSVMKLSAQIDRGAPPITSELLHGTRRLATQATGGLHAIVVSLRKHKISRRRAIVELRTLERRTMNQLASLRSTAMRKLDSLQLQGAQLVALQGRFTQQSAALLELVGPTAATASQDGPMASTASILGCLKNVFTGHFSCAENAAKQALDKAKNYVKSLGANAARTLENEGETLWLRGLVAPTAGGAAFAADVTGFGNLISTGYAQLAQNSDQLLGTVGQNIQLAGVQIEQGSESALQALLGLGGVIGVGFDWGQAPQFFSGTCGLSNYVETINLASDSLKAPRATVNAAAPSQTIRLKSGPAYTVLRLQGQGAAPLAIVDGPGGMHMVTPTGQLAEGAGGAVILRDPTTDTTFLEFRPLTGAYHVSLEPGSAPVTKIQHADALPAPALTALVTGTGARRTLAWSAVPIPGQQITFSTISAGGAQVIKTTSASSGKVSFRPSAGSLGPRTVLAEISQNGMPRDTIQVASFAGPSTPVPLAPAPLSFRRAGTTVGISWPRSNASVQNYIVHVSISDGRHLIYAPRTSSVLVGGVLPSDRLTVTVQALGATGVLSMPYTSSLAAA